MARMQNHGTRGVLRSLVLAVLTLGAAFTSGAAWADADKLDEAGVSTQKAIALLRDAESPGGPAARDLHRKKAIDLLTRAQGEILKAKGE